MKQIHRADLKAVKTIGAGQFGQVYLAMQKVLVCCSYGNALIATDVAALDVKRRCPRGFTRREAAESGGLEEGLLHDSKLSHSAILFALQDKEDFLREAETMLSLEDPNLACFT